MSHTPGPWIFREFSTVEDPEVLRKLGLKPVRLLTNQGAAPISNDKTRIATVDSQIESKRGQAYQVECPERDANARLIAAAPDLLAFAQEFLRVWAGPGKTDSPLEAQAREAITKATGQTPT